MIALSIIDIKKCMQQLFKDTTFDTFEVRSIDIQTFTRFHIQGILDKTFFPLEQQELITGHYVLWADIKPYVLQMIKGTRSPKLLKIVFSLVESQKDTICAEASALFLNLSFEEGVMTCTTGVSQKNFTLDRSVDLHWDEYVSNFFTRNEILVKQ